MGAIKSKLKSKFKSNQKDEYLGLHPIYKDNYDKAFNILDKKIHRIPLKHLVNVLDKNKFKDEDLLSTLIYLKQHTIDVDQKNYENPSMFMFRIQEIDYWIDIYQQKYWNKDDI